MFFSLVTNFLLMILRSIDDGCIFVHEIQALTRNHNCYSDDLAYIPYDQRNIEKPVGIGEYCCIGARVTILPDVKIGKGLLVVACSVVTKDCQGYAAGGDNPAKVIKYRNKEKLDELLSKDKEYIKCTKHYS